MIKELINKINEKRYFMGDYEGIKFFVSDHFLNQENRRTDISPKEFEELLKKIARELQSDPYGYDNAEYLFFSRKLQQGFILHWIPEKERVNLITFLPRKKSNPRDGTEKVIVENYDDIINIHFNRVKDYLWIDEDLKEPQRGVNTDFAIDVTILD